MSVIQSIVGELKSIHAGDAWHGPALKEILAGVSATQAAAHPLPQAHSIWELVRHIAGWEQVFLTRLAGQAMSEPPEGDFPQTAEVSEAAWQQTLAQLDETHNRLLETIAVLPDERWRETVSGEQYTIGQLLRSIVRHHVYHAGQIALLSKH